MKLIKIKISVRKQNKCQTPSQRKSNFVLRKIKSYVSFVIKNGMFRT